MASPEAVDLVARMLVYPPEARISAAEALEHTWLRKLGTLGVLALLVRKYKCGHMYI